MKQKFFIAITLILLLLPVLVFAQTCTPEYSGSKLCNAIPSFGGENVNDIPSFLQAAFTWLASIVATILMAVLIYSGLRMVLAQGDPGAIKTAKTSFTYAIVGFLVIIFGYTIVSMTQYFIGASSDDPEDATTFFFNPLKFTNLETFLESIIQNALVLIGTVVLFFLIWQGFRYVTAGANEEQTKSARQAITWSIIGLILTLLSYTIVMVVIRTIGDV
jgi:hypothetical protein